MQPAVGWMRRRFRRIGAGLALVPVVVSLLATPAGASPQPAPSCPPGPMAGGEWRSYGHDYRNTRNQQQEGMIDPVEATALRPVWVFSSKEAGGDGDFTGTPVVADGCVFVGSNDGWVFAFDADTGKLEWKTLVEKRGGINSTVSVTGGTVYAAVSRVSRPYLVALDQHTGKVRWRTTLDTQAGADMYASPVVFDGIVIIGVSGGAAELGDEADRYRFQGSFVLVDANTGRILRKTWTIRPPDPDPDDPKNDFAGANIWSTAAVDVASSTGYLVTGNPFRPQAEHKHANAIIKIDLDRASPTFGEILGHYHGTIDEYVAVFRELPCYDIPGNPPPYYPQGLGACQDLDLDFGASPNIFVDADGRKVVGAGQKSGVYHAADLRTMKGLWKTEVGPPSLVGGIVGSTAVDEDGIYGPVTVPGYLWSLGQDDGSYRWFAPTADGVHYGNPVAVANGVVYTVDFRGFLSAFDASTGVQLFAYPLWFGGGEGSKLSWGGVSIANHTVYAAVGITGGDGFVFAFRPA